MTSIFERLKRVARTVPMDAVALYSSREQLTYLELIEKIESYRQWLAGLEVKLVGLHLHNSVEWVALDLACQQLELACVPLPTFFTLDQIRQCVSDSGVDLLLSDSLNKMALAEINYAQLPVISFPRVDQGALFRGWKIIPQSYGKFPLGTQKITFTSGSTGQPKGVCLSLAHQWTVAETLAQVIDADNPKHLCLLPLSTLLENIAGVYAPLLRGGTVMLPTDEERGMHGSSRLDVATLLYCISVNEPTTLILIPQLLSVLVAACKNGWKPPQSLTFIAVGGGRVAPELLRSANELGLPVYQGYGLSECGSVVSLNTAPHHRIESVGNVLPHCSVAIEDSEVVVKGSLFLGYAGIPETWYPKKVATGDIGYINNGFLHISGRKKNQLISSFGRNISPEWVESVLMEQPLLSQCLVFGDGKPNLCALLSAPQQLSDCTVAAWINKQNQSLPDYAQVKYWHRLQADEFSPFLTANGRLQRNKVELAYADLIDQFYTEHTALIHIS